MSAASSPTRSCWWLCAWALCVALVWPHLARAGDPLAAASVPEPLRPWTEWALDGERPGLCPTLLDHADVVRCAWPSRLELELEEHGGRFVMDARVDAPSALVLPGDDKRWPIEVTVDGRPALVLARDGAPQIQVPPGEHRVAGQFSWSSLPESLRVPREVALVSTTVRGLLLATPRRDADGSLWLQKTPTTEEGDALEIVVNRRLVDAIPAILETLVELHVAGKSREEVLGRALPDGFIPMSLESPVGARLDPNGHLRVELRPGVFTIRLVARSDGPLRSVGRPEPGGPWRAGDEVWAFAARSDYRVVTVEGVPSIDPHETTLPDEWKRLPAYPMRVGAKLAFEEKRRGDADPPPNQLSLERTLWLDFDGAGYTVRDQIGGALHRDSRLTMAPPTLLGRVSVGGADQFITHLAGETLTGIEVRLGQLDVRADSRIESSLRDIPAVSWAHDFDHVGGTLHLAPGWRLVHASGVDDVPGTWVREWSLLEIFLALIVAIGVGRLHGARWGVVALAMLVLTLPEDGAPRWSWLPLLAADGLHRALPPGLMKAFLRGARLAALLAVALIATPFLVDHVREALYPALSNPSAVVGAEDTSEAAAPDVTSAGKAGAMNGTGANAKDEVRAAASAAVAEALQGAPAAAGSLAAAPAAPVPGRAALRQSNAQVYDPSAIVQTGPGLPRWQWTTLPLHWSGPVSATQRLHLLLLTPDENLALAFARAVLLIVVLLRMVPRTARLFPGGWAPRAAAMSMALAALLASPCVRADVPSPEVLHELRERLLRPPACTPNCASSDRMSLDAHGDVLRVRFEVAALARTAIPLPGRTSQWTPTQVLLDGQPALGLTRLTGSTTAEWLWLEVDAGRHQVLLEGPTPAGASMQLALPLKPHRVEATASGWTIAGLHEDGLADDDLELTRVQATAGDHTTLQGDTLPPFARVERALSIGLDWEVDTRVFRVSPPGSAIVLEVPLLAGESVTTAGVRVVSGKVLVNLAPNVSEASWHAVLEEKSPLRLTAPRSIAWTEVWRLDVGPVWHASFSGIPFVHADDDAVPSPGGAARGPVAAAGAAGARIPEWRPWPGEEAGVVLSRPEGVPGQTLTIDDSATEIRPGLRATDVQLELGARSSRGAEHTFTLPEGAELQSVSINGATQPIRQNGRRVTVPMVPGSQRVALAWREPAGIAPFFRSASFDLGSESVNATTTVRVPGGRWLLLVGGPLVGPAILFWSLLLALLVVALALGQNHWTPLRWWHWLLLGIGLSQVNVAAGAFFAAWLVVLGWRARAPGEGLSRRWFNARQCALAFWTIGALQVLGVSLYQGLLGAPEMQILGNGSSADLLRWFVDRSPPAPPGVWLISVPILVYRAAMLGWALWIAFALLGWLRWGWAAAATGGLWRPRPKEAPVAPAPDSPPASPG